MQAKAHHREQAENLRRKGWSYRQILKVVPVAKSSLSLWLRDIDLTKAQQEVLKELNTEGQKAAAQARHQQRLDRLEKLQREVDQELPSLLQSSFFTTGLALYWAEGTKQKPWNVSARAQFCNSDPRTIILMLHWFKTFAHINEDSLTFRLHIHITANVEKARKEWAKILYISEKKISITLKKHNTFGRHKQDDYKGVIKMTVLKSAFLNNRITFWTQALSEAFLSD